MTETTLDRIKALAGDDLEGLSDEQLTMFMEDAQQEVADQGFPATKTEIATRYLAAHNAFMANGGNERVSKEKVDVLEVDYALPPATVRYLRKSVYGDYYLYLWKKYADGGNHIGLVVI